MFEILEELSRNTADSAIRQILQPDSVGDGESQGDPKQPGQITKYHITDHSRVDLCCQALEMPHLKCSVGSKLRSR